VNAVLAELGRQFAGRWAAALLLPGACYAVAAVIAAVLGQDDALDPRPLRDWLDAVAAARASDRGGTVLIGAVAFTAASAAAGAAAAALAVPVERLWGATGREPLLRPFAAARRRRWERAEAGARAALAEFTASGAAPAAAARLRDAIAARDAIGTVPAERPTWTGDRLFAADQRVHTAYHLDLAAVWPRLWLLLPEHVRPELAAAQGALAAAARLTGWGLLYLALAVLWWPAALIGGGVLVTARWRTRDAAAVYADLVEAAVDLHGRDLAAQLGLDATGPLGRDLGGGITSLLRKDPTDATPPDALPPAPPPPAPAPGGPGPG
jgi:hypothetical protein